MKVGSSAYSLVENLRVWPLATVLGASSSSLTILTCLCYNASWDDKCIKGDLSFRPSDFFEFSYGVLASLPVLTFLALTSSRIWFLYYVMLSSLWLIDHSFGLNIFGLGLARLMLKSESETKVVCCFKNSTLFCSWASFYFASLMTLMDSLWWSWSNLPTSLSNIFNRYKMPLF